MQKLKITGFAGSLRKKSYNRMLLGTLAELFPQNLVEFHIFDLANIPLYNGDLEKITPESVLELKRAVGVSDGIIFVTPEYNYSYSGVLKNAIDWGSRPPEDNVWDNKPVGILGASTGGFGTTRAQLQLRQLFSFINAYDMKHPEIYVSYAANKFDSQGKLIDMELKEKLQGFIEAYINFVRLFAGELSVGS